MFGRMNQTKEEKQIIKTKNKSRVKRQKSRLISSFIASLSFFSNQIVYATSFHQQNKMTKVVVVGGTHGNEYTGVWCIKSIQKQQKVDKSHPSESSLLKKYPSLTISTILANPQAYMENKRFIDTDLNREFSKEKLSNFTMNPNTEQRRAKEINSILGPKFDEHAHTDVIVDLHSTTTNMGITIIIPEGDAVMAQAAAYVLAKCNENPSKEVVCRCIMHSILDRMKRPNVSSIGKHGFTIEVGPVPQGVLRHDAVEHTQKALHYLLEFLQLRNENLKKMQNTLEMYYPNNKVPCFLSAPAKKEGEMSGKIIWPCDEDNPNFPSLMVHEQIQDRDFQKIRKGDPLFVKWDGSTVHYDGSHGVRV